MYTFVESRPEKHPTKRTTFVRLDDECKITIGVEDGNASRIDTQYNFSGLVTHYEPSQSEPNIQSVFTVEWGENGMCGICVRMYDDANATGENRPIGGFYDYKPGEGWCFWGYESSEENPGTETQEFPIVLWNTTNTTRAGSLPGENTEPSLITDAMIREQRDSQAIAEGRGIKDNTGYGNFQADEFLKHSGEVCDEREYFFRGEPKHYKRGLLEGDVITSGLCGEVINDFNNKQDLQDLQDGQVMQRPEHTRHSVSSIRSI